MLAEVLRNAAKGIIPGPLIFSDRLEAEHVRQVQREQAAAATTDKAPLA